MKLQHVQRIGRYHYLRMPGRKRERLPGAPGSKEYLAAYERAITAPAIASAAAPSIEPRTVRYLPGTLGWVIDRYLASAEFAGRKPGTQKTYRYVLRLLDGLAGAQLIDIETDHLNVYCQKLVEENGPSRAHLAQRLFSVLWRFAGGLKEIKRAGKANPALDVRRHYKAKAHVAWPDDLQRRFVDGASERVRLAFALLLYTGQRRCDVVRMQWSDYDGSRIVIVTEKTGERVPLRVHRNLKRILDATPRRGKAILLNNWGRPYSENRLTHVVQERLAEIGAPAGKYCTHGLRRSAAKMLAEIGCSVQQIMAVLGHRKPEMALYYCNEASKRKLIDAAFDAWERAA